MNLTELIMNANARGHIGIRGTFPGQGDIPVVNRALDLGLIRLVSAWRSDEDDLPEYRGGPVDRRVYALTHKGWDLKINARDTLPSYKASILAEALATHYGELDEGPDLRYPEEAFNDWQGDPCTPRVVFTAKGEDVIRQSAKAPTDITPPPGYALIHDEIYPVDEVIASYPGAQLPIPDDYWLPPMPYPSPRRYEVLAWELLGAGVILAVLVLIGWWLS